MLESEISRLFCPTVPYIIGSSYFFRVTIKGGREGFVKAPASSGRKFFRLVIKSWLEKHGRQKFRQPVQEHPPAGGPARPPSPRGTGDDAFRENHEKFRPGFKKSAGRAAACQKIFRAQEQISADRFPAFARAILISGEISSTL